jgi:hypothetical protein
MVGDRLLLRWGVGLAGASSTSATSSFLHVSSPPGSMACEYTHTLTLPLELFRRRCSVTHSPLRRSISLGSARDGGVKPHSSVSEWSAAERTFFAGARFWRTHRQRPGGEQHSVGKQDTAQSP